MLKCNKKALDLFIQKGKSKERHFMGISLAMVMIQTITFHFKDIETVPAYAAMRNKPVQWYSLDARYILYVTRLLDIRTSLLGTDDIKSLAYFRTEMRTLQFTMYAIIKIQQDQYAVYKPYGNMIDASTEGASLLQRVARLEAEMLRLRYVIACSPQNQFQQDTYSKLTPHEQFTAELIYMDGGLLNFVTSRIEGHQRETIQYADTFSTISHMPSGDSTLTFPEPLRSI
jgi:hypothetical protein